MNGPPGPGQIHPFDDQPFGGQPPMTPIPGVNPWEFQQQQEYQATLGALHAERNYREWAAAQTGAAATVIPGNLAALPTLTPNQQARAKAQRRLASIKATKKAKEEAAILAQQQAAARATKALNEELARIDAEDRRQAGLRRVAEDRRKSWEARRRYVRELAPLPNNRARVLLASTQLLLGTLVTIAFMASAIAGHLLIYPVKWWAIAAIVPAIIIVHKIAYPERQQNAQIYLFCLAIIVGTPAELIRGGWHVNRWSIAFLVAIFIGACTISIPAEEALQNHTEFGRRAYLAISKAHDRHELACSCGQPVVTIRYGQPTNWTGNAGDVLNGSVAMCDSCARHYGIEPTSGEIGSAFKL